jgi:hypothetical protein
MPDNPDSRTPAYLTRRIRELRKVPVDDWLMALIKNPDLLNECRDLALDVESTLEHFGLDEAWLERLKNA